MARRYWERNYEVQMNLLKDSESSKSSEPISGKLGSWMEKGRRTGSQQANLGRNKSLFSGKLDTTPMLFQDLSADTLKKNSTCSSLHTSSLINLDFSGTKTFQDHANDPSETGSSFSSLHSNISNGIDFSGSRPFQDLPTSESPMKSLTFSNLYNNPLVKIDFSSSRPVQDISMDPAKHTSLFSSSVTNNDRRSRPLGTGACPVNESSPSSCVPGVDTFVPHLLLPSQKPGQTGVFQFFPPLSPHWAQRLFSSYPLPPFPRLSTPLMFHLIYYTTR
ncbi:uncharacterized protein LOC141505268 [Macrotis lagotis]|uniref:uncharacterized protein LOC141505268 n=1 Tax=Macrotis lagotis TaxID=92651 RepID=UPI003D69D53D